VKALFLSEQAFQAQGGTPDHIRGYVAGLLANDVEWEVRTCGYVERNPLLRAVYAARCVGAIGELRTDRWATNVIWATGVDDSDMFAQRYPGTAVFDVPQGVGHDTAVERSGINQREAFTFGTWAYPPNWEGLIRLCSAESSGGTLTVFGRVANELKSLVEERKAKSLNVTFAGFREDISEVYDEGRGPLIIPVWTGGGVKTRTTEAAAKGVPVIGPCEAARGLPDWIADGLTIVEDPSAILEAAWSTSGANWELAAQLRASLASRYSWQALVGSALSGAGLFDAVTTG